MADGDDGVVSPWGLLHLESFWTPYQDLGAVFFGDFFQNILSPRMFFLGEMVIQLDQLAYFILS